MGSPGSQAAGKSRNALGGTSSKSTSSGNKGMFGRPNQAMTDTFGSTNGITSSGGLSPIGGLTKGKPTSGTDKPGEDKIAAANAANVNPVALTDVQKAVIEARRQRSALKPGVDVASTLLGLMPSNVPMGAALSLGNFMGKKTEDDAGLHPENYHTNLKDPGSLYSNSGPVSTNRAVLGPAAKNTNASTDESIKKKKQALPTLLGAPAQALGTFSNPVMIT